MGSKNAHLSRSESCDATLDSARGLADSLTGRLGVGGIQPGCWLVQRVVQRHLVWIGWQWTALDILHMRLRYGSYDASIKVICPSVAYFALELEAHSHSYSESLVFGVSRHASFWNQASLSNTFLWTLMISHIPRSSGWSSVNGSRRSVRHKAGVPLAPYCGDIYR